MIPELFEDIAQREPGTGIHKLAGAFVNVLITSEERLFDSPPSYIELSTFELFLDRE